MGSVRIVALSGLAGSGKNTVADMLPGEVVTLSFADPLKRFCQEVFDFSDLQIYGPSEHRNAPDPRYTRPNGEPLTPRYALQTLGTEWGRGCYEDVWADLGVRRAVRLLSLHDLGPEGDIPLVVFTDCRFINEAKAVRAAGGEVWRVYRPGSGLGGAAAAHPSEQEQLSDEFSDLVSVTIFNDGTEDDLARSVASLARSRLYGFGQ